MTEKEIHEWRIYKRFEQLVEGLRTDQTRRADPPDPDFVIPQPDGTNLGLEITCYYRPSEGRGIPKEQEALRNKLTQQISEHLDRSGVKPISIRILFNELYPLTKERVLNREKGVSMLCADLVTVIREAVQRTGEFSLSLDAVDRPDLPPEVSLIMLDSLACLTRTSCSAPASSYVPALHPEELQARIDKKAVHMPGYRRICRETMLLIAVDGYHWASVADLSEGPWSIPTMVPFPEFSSWLTTSAF